MAVASSAPSEVAGGVARPGNHDMMMIAITSSVLGQPTLQTGTRAQVTTDKKEGHRVARELSGLV